MTEDIMHRIRDRVLIKGDNSFDVAHVGVDKKTGEEAISSSGRAYYGKIEDAAEWMVRDIARDEAKTLRQYVAAIRKAVREVKNAIHP